MSDRHRVGAAMRWSEGAPRRLDPPGYTLIEVSLVLCLLSVVVASAFAVLAGQRRFYAAHLQVAAARDAARVALTLLSTELRAASPESGDLYAVALDSVALRSYVGSGVVCGINGDEIGLRRIAGTFTGSRNDSLLVFLEHDFETAADDTWVGRALVATRNAVSGRCPDGQPPDIVLTVDAAIHGAPVGAPVRAFRPYVYRLYQGSAGRWWLGQRLRDGRFQPVTGPFADPTVGGLRFEFLGRDGRSTEDARAVVEVRISVRARSPRPVPGRAGPRYLHESLASVVTPRNRSARGARAGSCWRRWGPNE
ncbi:MAG: hypothetical protein JSV86_02125 [Gemmatimonadota bacterium]|nr:MAG: hypothetical protein JSV86_02125 [Gemmatimonadota bacterium]